MLGWGTRPLKGKKEEESAWKKDSLVGGDWCLVCALSI
jgi:hypothetical protein